jgi:hypothetical protein
VRTNIDQLTESELIDLNRRVVERLRMIRQMHAHVRMLEFALGERVWFQSDLREIKGVLIRYNKKSVTVLTDEGERWTVSPGLLQKSETSTSADRDGTVIEMKKSVRSGR